MVGPVWWCLPSVSRHWCAPPFPTPPVDPANGAAISNRRQPRQAAQLLGRAIFPVALAHVMGAARVRRGLIKIHHLSPRRVTEQLRGKPCSTAARSIAGIGHGEPPYSVGSSTVRVVNESLVGRNWGVWPRRISNRNHPMQGVVGIAVHVTGLAFHSH